MYWYSLNDLENHGSEGIDIIYNVLYYMCLLHPVMDHTSFYEIMNLIVTILISSKTVET